MALSRSEKTFQARQRRKRDSEGKRFNNPLKIYVERKHPKIFKEFKKFLNFFERANPRKKDLTKSETFRQWMLENPIPSETSSSTIANTNPSETSLASEINSSSTIANTNPSETSLASEINSSSSIANTNPSETSLASEINSSSTIANTNPSETSTTPNTLSQLVDELFDFDGIPDEVLFGNNENDEGIELNSFDELAYDYEPFDFLNETKDF